MLQLKPIKYDLNAKVKEGIVIEIKKENTQTILNAYKKYFPNYLIDNQLTHLKLIRLGQNKNTIQILIGLKEHEDLLIQQLQTELSQIEVEKFYVCIPVTAPIDKAQLEIWGKLWNISNTLLLSFPKSIEHNEAKIKQLMREAIDSALINFQKGYRANSCILFNDSKNCIISRIDDNVDRNNSKCINHCVMQLTKMFGMSLSQESQNNQKEIQLEKRKAQYTIDQNYEDSFKLEQYFLKDLSLIMVQEPCIMCSMALVHSRIKVVYYSIQNKELKGGMNSNLQINSMDQLNHRFIVYNGVEYDYAIEKLCKLQ